MRQSLSKKNIKKIDRSSMLAVLLDFPSQCKQALDIALNLKSLPETRDIQKIVFAGVGGSAIGADVVRSYLYLESKIPVTIVREYQLPAYVDEKTLVFVSSYSGNTAETLSAYNQAKEKNAVVAVLSSGGKLKEIASRDGASFIEIPKGLPPRYAIGFLSIIPLCILDKLGLAKDVNPSIHQAIKTLEEIRVNRLHPNIGVKDNISKYMATELFNKFPVIYSSSLNFEAVARRFRSQLNENSKTLSLSASFPEVCHNEIMGWKNPARLLKDFTVVMFRDKQMYQEVAKKMELTKDILKEEGVEILEIWSEGRELLSKIFSLIYIGDFISFYLAILYGIDPAPTDRISYLKK